MKSSSYYSGVQSCCWTSGPAIVCGTNLYISGSITLLWNTSSRLSVGLKGCISGTLIYRRWNLGGRGATVRPFFYHGLEDAVYCINTTVLCLPQLNKCLENPAQQRKASYSGSCLLTHLGPPAPVHESNSLFQIDTSQTVPLKNRKQKGFSPNLQRATQFLI